MKRIISKQVVALFPGGQLLQDEYFRNIRERAFNKDRNTHKEDTGNTKKTVIETLGLGSNDRGHSIGMGLGRDEHESSDHSLSSGYNKDNQNRPIEDDTGPGLSKQTPDPYYGSTVFNELFMDLALKNQGNNDTIRGHLNKTLSGTPIVTPHRRHNVDNLD